MKTLNLSYLVIVSVLVACGGGAPPSAAPSSSTEPNAVTRGGGSGSAAAATAPEQAKLSMVELQLRSLREYVKAFNRHDAKAIAALYSEEAAFIERGAPGSSGRSAITSSYKDYFDTYPDATTAITRSWHWGDSALFEFAESGTQKGERIVLPPPPQALDPLGEPVGPKAEPRRVLKPTNKKFGYVGASLLRFTPDGLVRSDMTYADELTREVQSGLAPAQLMKLAVREVTLPPAASDTWETHQISDTDVGQPKLYAAKSSLYTKFALGSQKDFVAAMSDNVMLSAYDDPKDARGKVEAGGVFKEWTSMFSDAVVDATEGYSVDGYVVLLGTFTGKHIGPWGPLKATGRTFKTHFLDIAKVDKSDKIEHLWSYANNYELLQYLGYEREEAPGPTDLKKKR